MSIDEVGFWEEYQVVSFPHYRLMINRQVVRQLVFHIIASDTDMVQMPLNCTTWISEVLDPCTAMTVPGNHLGPLPKLSTYT